MHVVTKKERVLSVDPGYERLGIAVLEKDAKGREVCLYSNCFQTSKKDAFYDRLQEIGNETLRIVRKFRPESLAIETLFFNTNQKTAMNIAETRGVIIYQSINDGLAIFQYTPLQIKTAITGDGRADKKQIISLVPKLIDISKDIKYDDEYDAIAVGLTHFAYGRNA